MARPWRIEYEGAYYHVLSRSIHRNPVRAGMVKRLKDYNWSSDPANAYRRKAPRWLKSDPILFF